MPPGTAQATFAATLVDEWIRCGVRHAVIAPGSRSTPLALALAGSALVCDVHHDERSAGFQALGIGLETGVPAVVLTTSGTAAAELHAAVVEASYGRVPLLVCTADRPPELHHIGAPQTIDQAHLYGRAVRWFADPGVADEAASGSWRSLAARAFLEAVGSPAGPVHLNLAFRDPLVAEPGPLPQGRPDGGPWHRLVRPSGAPDVGGFAGLLDAERGVIVAGGRGADAEAVGALAAATGWPVLADPRSGCRVPGAVAAADALLRSPSFAAAHRPDVVVRLGEPPASKVLGQWLAASGARQVVVDRDGTWFDPDRTAEVVVAADPSAWCRALAGVADGGVGDWAKAWLAAEEAAQAAIDAVLARHPEITEPGVARRLSAQLEEGATLVVSSSMPVRDLEWYAAPRTGLRVLANRGANGIDGVVSTAVGVATAAAGPTALLIGDVALLHDANGLLGLAARELDLTIVVVDNRGGGIFSFLPQASSLPGDRFERLFGTPHDVDPAALAAVHGLPAMRAHDAEGLDAALAATRAVADTVVVVAQTDRAVNVAVHDELHAAVAAALEG